MHLISLYHNYIFLNFLFKLINVKSQNCIPTVMDNRLGPTSEILDNRSFQKKTRKKSSSKSKILIDYDHFRLG